MNGDWIDTFVEQTEALLSPRIFRLWAGIATIACTLERRVWTETDGGQLRPNLYTVLTGPPASGKTMAVMKARELLAGVRGISLGPDNPTDASFMDALEASGKANGSGIYSAMAVLCREFGVLIPKYNEAFFAVLSQIYDNEPTYTAPRRTSRSVVIEGPTVNILAAATPAALGSLPEAAWGEGFTSRVIFIYATKPKTYRDMFKKANKIDLIGQKKALEEFMNELHGEFEWSQEAQEALRYWFNEEGMAPVPTYGRLVNYLGRRNEHVMKLAMVSAISAGNGLFIAESDLRRAQRWLFEAEATMPDVFRAITQKSDEQLITDVFHYIYAEWSKVARNERVPVPEKLINRFMESRTTSERIPIILKAMESSGRLKKQGFQGFIPIAGDARM